ncbi:GtrA family protein [Clostridium tyrobutyricum]|uniref:GtrA family protein n=1 Tax=Clostridium tyrobutyricum TaxID=1519 RepID=UPI0005806E94|nr:GtrA family protein [Clostridium tyrobutyricum]
MNRLKNIIDIKTLKFLIVGIVNTLVGTFIMFSFYNLLGLNYWISSSANYILASILSYILNKYWTFQNREKSVKIVFKFIVNILVCYLISYGVAKPLVRSLLSAAGTKIQDNVSMLVGMILFTVLNYFGQRFFAFKKHD